MSNSEQEVTDSKRIRAIKQAEVLAQSLSDQIGTEIITMYLGDWGYARIARHLQERFPDGNYSVLLSAIKLVIRNNLSPHERQKLELKHVRSLASARNEDGTYKLIGAQGARKRMDSLSPSEFAEMGKKGVRARGLTVWTEEERGWAKAHLDDYRNPKGINYGLLASDLNENFHQGKPIRTKNIANTIRSRR